MQYLAYGLLEGSILALLALGFGLRFRSGRFFDFSYGGVALVGAYANYTARRLGSGPAIGIVLGVLVAAAMGWILELWVFGPLRRRDAGALVLLLASFGVLVIMENGLGLIFGPYPKHLDVLQGLRHILELGEVRLSTIQLLLIGAAFALQLAVLVLYKKTRFGLRLRACGSDPELSEIAGWNQDRTLLMGAVSAGVIAGLGGILASYERSVYFGQATEVVLMAFVAVLVFGDREVWWSAAGGLTIGLVSNVLLLFVPSTWQRAIVFTSVMGIILLRRSWKRIGE